MIDFDWALKIKTIKQMEGSKDCMACCAAMLCDTSPEDFKEYCTANDLPLYDDFSFISYIRRHHFVVGFFVPDSPEQSFDKDSLFKLFDGGPCYLTVESDREEVRAMNAVHAVLWDGEKVRDPNPRVEGHGRPLCDYTVKTIIPIVAVDEEDAA